MQFARILSQYAIINTCRYCEISKADYSHVRLYVVCHVNTIHVMKYTYNRHNKKSKFLVNKHTHKHMSAATAVCSEPSRYPLLSLHPRPFGKSQVRHAADAKSFTGMHIITP